MGVYAKKPILPRIILTSTFVALFLVLPFALGCVGGVDISFTVDSVTLFVGDSRDIFPYIKFTPAVTDDKRISVSIDGDCVESDGTTLRAVKPGSATVTAYSSGGEATLNIDCKYRPAGRMSVYADKPVQSADNAASIDPVVFTAELDDYVDPNAAPVWSVNGAEAESGRTFTFNPPSYGRYIVSASIDDVTEAVEVAVYRSTEAHIEAIGELTQNKSYSPITFTAREDIDTRNPASVYEWKVNGEVKSTSILYEFIPSSPGDYRIELEVNGVSRKYEDRDFVIVSVSGERAPIGAVVFDDTDSVRIEWADKQNISSVSITSPDGSRKTYSRADIAHTGRFYAGYFDAAELIEVCAELPSTYTVRLTADGQGDEFTFTQLPLSAKPYIDKKVLISNSFLGGVSDAEMWLKELYACGESYGMGYNAVLTEDELIGILEATASMLGVGIAVEFDGKVVDVEFGEYVNAPTVPISTELRYSYCELPHIEYDKNNLRYRIDKNSYKLEIERLARSVAVQNTEQLLIAAMGGYNPTFTKGSSVEASFTQAKNVLLSIIGIKYDEFDKVHAIYDWMQWVTRRTDGNKNQTCDYIEAYFSGTMNVAEAYRHGAASSEGAAKTFALLCAMEGIECDIVTNRDGNRIIYSNTVNIDGVYYNVDVYGGKADGDVGEFGSHSGLLTAGGDIYAFDRSKTYYLQKSYCGSVYYDRYVTADETGYEDVKAVIFGAFDACTIGKVSIPLVGSTETVANPYFGAEIMLDDGISQSEKSAILSNMEKAVKEYLTALGAKSDSLSYKINDGGGFVYVTASAPIITQTE